MVARIGLGTYVSRQFVYGDEHEENIAYDVQKQAEDDGSVLPSEGVWYAAENQYVKNIFYFIF